MFKRFRLVLSRPFWLLRWFAFVVGVAFWKVGRVVSHGVRDHFWLVFLRAERAVAGQPRWTADDLFRWGIQPRSKADIELAEKDERLVRLICPNPDCEDPKCPSKPGNHRFIQRPPIDVSFSIPANMAPSEIMQRLRNAIRAPEPAPPVEPETGTPDAFTRDIAAVINRHSIDNAFGVPDYILAQVATDSIMLFTSNVDQLRKHEKPADKPEAA